MTEEEKQAYEWAKNQQYQSVAARYARILANYIDKLSKPSPDKVREILIRHFEPVDVDDKVDFAYSLTQTIKEICGG